MNPSEKKAERILQIEQLLLAHPEGLTQAEIARRLNVDRSTISRYQVSMPAHIYIDDLDGNRWKVNREAYLIHVRFSLNEALAVHLATRLLATRMERQNPYAASALRKLATSLKALAPKISQHMQRSADVMDDPGQLQDPNFIRTLEVLTLAWAEGHKTRVWHRSEDGQISESVFSPYFIEPYAVGQAVHVIGLREPPETIRTLKVERIERIEPIEEQYHIPDDFDPEELLKYAWGIWFTEDEPVEVVLKFSPHVASRVQETRWHRTEQVVCQEDGSLLWRAWIDEPQEMMPWIRGWGSDVEVLEPENVREALIKEVHRLNEVYEI